MPRHLWVAEALLTGSHAHSLQTHAWHQGFSWLGSASALPSVSAAGRLLVSAIRRLTPTSHWLTSFTWSTMSERWISSAASQCCCWSSARKGEPISRVGSTFLQLAPCLMPGSWIQPLFVPHLVPGGSSSSSPVQRASPEPRHSPALSDAARCHHTLVSERRDEKEGGDTPPHQLREAVGRRGGCPCLEVSQTQAALD